MTTLSTSKPWLALKTHHATIADRHMREWFVDNPLRFDEFSLEAAGLFLDYSKNRITAETMRLLLDLAENVRLPAQIDALLSGQPVNTTEQRASLHTALRHPASDALSVGNADIQTEIVAGLHHMQTVSESIRNGEWFGFSNKPMTDVVNIGIGGSDLGPRMATEALTAYATENVRCHFVSNVDGTHIQETLKSLNPETTLFIVSSKSFTTKETLLNAQTAKEWLLKACGTPNALQPHLLAVTAHPDRATAFGVHAENILKIWDWVGGRYSLWSAIGLPIAIQIGMERFHELLAGAHAMDQHFRHAPLHANMPVILALLGIWYINFFHAKNHAILPYNQYLQHLPAYLQQADMESSGKQTCHDGTQVDYETGPILWGAVGCDGQHAFHQALHQGTQLIPADFIIPMTSHNPVGEHHVMLYANCLSQTQALMQGKTETDIMIDLMEQGVTQDEAKRLAAHKVTPGNRPSNTLLMPLLTPQALGALIALYEHKIFVQGAIWSINSFDQWGVELGKELAETIRMHLSNANTESPLDASTQGLIKRYQEKKSDDR